MINNLVLRLYCSPQLGFQKSDSLLQSLEPLEYLTEELCLQKLLRDHDVLASGILTECGDPLASPDALLTAMHDRGIKVLFRWDSDYPPALREIPKAPPILFYQGLLPNPQALSIGIVGSRRCTAVGMQGARDISRVLSEHGASVISGLAEGIDTAAHEGALTAQGYTLAVLGCGLNHNYPASNLRLRHQILNNGGGILSEFPPYLPARTWNFPRRNRIISGLSRGIAVIEASMKSGSLITARYALDHDRDLFAVPGSIRNPVSEGTNHLLKAGAIPITCGSDIFDYYAIGISPPRNFQNQSYDLNDDELALIKIMNSLGPVTLDALASSAAMKIPQLSGILTALEIKGMVQHWITGEFALKK